MAKQFHDIYVTNIPYNEFLNGFLVYKGTRPTVRLSKVPPGDIIHVNDIAWHKDTQRKVEPTRGLSNCQDDANVAREQSRTFAIANPKQPPRTSVLIDENNLQATLNQVIDENARLLAENRREVAHLTEQINVRMEWLREELEYDYVNKPHPNDLEDANYIAMPNSIDSVDDVDNDSDSDSIITVIPAMQQ